MASLGIASPVDLSRTPKALEVDDLALARDERHRAGILPASISPRSARVTRSSRSDESPTCSGFAVGSPCAQT